MKIKYLYFIFYRNGDGQILKYITNAPELFARRAEAAPA